MSNQIIQVNFFIIALILIAGCSSTYSDKGWFEEATTADTAVTALNESKYKMIYLDVSNSRRHDLEQDIQEFGNNLGEYGNVVELAYLSKVEQKRFLTEALTKLGKSYEYYDSPFLIFFTGSTTQGAFKPYYILPFGGVNRACIKTSLNRIENKVHKGNDEIFTPTEFYKQEACSIYENNKGHVYTAFKDLAGFLLKRKK